LSKQAETVLGKKINHRGAILIEFAVSIPVLLAVLYYMHDLPKYARMKERMKFCAHCAVNMFQNISQNRENKRITWNDYRYISAMSFLPYFGAGTQQYFPLWQSPEGGFPASRPCGQMTLAYIKGTGPNRAKIVWAVISYWAASPVSTSRDIRTFWELPTYVNVAQTIVGREYAADQICKGLQINEGEVKIMIDAYINASWCEGQLGKERVSPQLWGLLIYTPKAESYGSGTGGWFHTYIIFTPNPGLFSETPPQ